MTCSACEANAALCEARQAEGHDDGVGPAMCAAAIRSSCTHPAGVVVPVRFVEGCIQMLEYGRCTTRDSNAADTYARFRDEAKSYLSEREAG